MTQEPFVPPTAVLPTLIAAPDAEPSTARSLGNDARTRSERRELARSFGEVAVAIARTPPNSDDRLSLAARAAHVLVGLAELSASATLAELLRPDPTMTSVTWTVACYQIGDLVPCSLADYTDAAKAVQSLSDCPEPSHVAAELIASSDSGLRWSALLRAGQRLQFQFPTTSSCSSSSSTEQSALADAIEHWRERLSVWARSDVAQHVGEDTTLEESESVGDYASAGDHLGALAQMISEITAKSDKQQMSLEELTDLLAVVDRRLSRIERAIVGLPVCIDVEDSDIVPRSLQD